MNTKSNTSLPHDEMIQAMLNSDSAYEGIFFTAVKTTHIFCRPTCPARKPKPENVEFFSNADDALAAGYRPCKRCKPLNIPDETPLWVTEFLQQVASNRTKRWDDASIAAVGVEPLRLRRWFKKNMGMTFHSYLRTKKLGEALGQIQGGDTIDGAAFGSGYESLSGFREAFQKTFGVSAGKSTEILKAVFKRIETPLGPMLAVATSEALSLLEFIDRPALIDELSELKKQYGYHLIPGENQLLAKLEAELAEYFQGKRVEFTVKIEAPGTDFQKEVWAALCEIECGQTKSYGQVSEVLNKKGGARAIGIACGKNRVAILIPCHRVIGADGALTGYGGGKIRKQYLLELEHKMMLYREAMKRASV